MTVLEVGQAVKCTLPGRRSFTSTVLAVREGEAAVDVSDPRNGGRRTLRLEYVTAIRRRRS